MCYPNSIACKFNPITSLLFQVKVVVRSAGVGRGVGPGPRTNVSIEMEGGKWLAVATLMYDDGLVHTDSDLLLLLLFRSPHPPLYTCEVSSRF